VWVIALPLHGAIMSDRPLGAGDVLGMAL